MDDMTWRIVALLLTCLGLAVTLWLFQRRGPLAGATALGWTLLVPAAWLTGLLELFTRVGTAISRWVAQLAFSPGFWIGIGLGGLGLLTIFVTTVLRRRGRTPATQAHPSAPAVQSSRPSSPSARRGAQPQASSDDFDDIEALLRSRGIE